MDTTCCSGRNVIVWGEDSGGEGLGQEETIWSGQGKSLLRYLLKVKEFIFFFFCALHKNKLGPAVQLNFPLF